MRRNVLEVKDLVRNYRKSVIKESEEDVKRYVYNQISGGETRKNDTYIERSVIGRKICRDAEKPTNDS